MKSMILFGFENSAEPAQKSRKIWAGGKSPRILLESV